MKKTREQRRAELQAKADAIIEQLLEWTDNTEKPNLTQIEEIVLKLRGELGQTMVANVVSAQEAVQPVDEVRCSKCGQVMRYKGKQGKQMESRAGEVEVERGYYRCPECEGGIFPPG
jgi:rubredoxin